MTAEPANAPSVGLTIAGTPDDDEVAAIVAAIGALWPRPGDAGGPVAQAEPERWRFSGRWWAKPVPARRDRPGGGF